MGWPLSDSISPPSRRCGSGCSGSWIRVIPPATCRRRRSTPPASHRSARARPQASPRFHRVLPRAWLRCRRAPPRRMSRSPPVAYRPTYTSSCSSYTTSVPMAHRWHRWQPIWSRPTPSGPAGPRPSECRSRCNTPTSPSGIENCSAASRIRNRWRHDRSGTGPKPSPVRRICWSCQRTARAPPCNQCAAPTSTSPSTRHCTAPSSNSRPRTMSACSWSYTPRSRYCSRGSAAPATW